MEQNCFNVRGRVADVQRYSIHDGPGIRTIVFLKGCHFRCRWCCNPEMQEYAIETMVVNGVPKTVGRDMSVAEVMQEVVKDRDYYRNSGGGMTLSGGECLSQPEFAIALLQAAKEEGLNTAIETTGFASYEEVIARVLPNLDTCLMDIKHMDAAKHKAFTGQSNALCLKNAAKIAANAKKLIIRVPTIPGFNDTPEEIEAIARFAASLPGVEQLHLLPYHRLGQDKYRWLNREYTLPDIRPPENEHMAELLRIAQQSGLHCQIGG